MNEVTIYNGVPSEVISKIANIQDFSHPVLGSKMRITFVNGYAISIIRGPYTYGGSEGLFEIAPVEKDGELNGQLLNIEHDDVQGYLSKNEVFERIEKMANL